MERDTLVARPASRDAGLFFHPNASPARRHLLGLEGMPREQILEILDEAAAIRARWHAGERQSSELEGVEVVNAFFEDSTRTRVSFELAERRLGALTVSISSSGSSVSKGETLLDTMRTVVAMGVDMVVVRHAQAGVPGFLAAHLDATVINAGDGEHEHPTQALLDLVTLRDAWNGSFEGRRLAIVGDIAHSRVARSAIFGLTTLGARVTVAGPATLIPDGVEALGCDVAPSAEDAMTGADGVMALRIQRERMDGALIPSLAEYARLWGIDSARVKRMAPGAPVLHPGPMNRGVEIANDVADGERSVVLDQVQNGVAVRAAVLGRCAAVAAAA
jgi:aspartate carbamoyltransferase catalytic subunit